MLSDLSMARHRLALAGLGILIPIVFSTVTDENTTGSLDLTDEVFPLHAICRSPTCFTFGMAPLVRS
jgi:hypothetical protein